MPHTSARHSGLALIATLALFLVAVLASSATAAFGAGGREVSWLHRDHLGPDRNPGRAITRVKAGIVEITEKATYKPFGEQSEVNTATALPAAPETKGWIGERFDADAGLQYLNARYYDPMLGMFLQPDWFEVTKAGVGTNRYSYSFNDPVNLIDPGGNLVFSASGLAGWEATQSKKKRDETYKHNARVHSELAKHFREVEGPDDVIKYHEDAAAYYNGRVGISTEELLAEAATDLAYASLGVRYVGPSTAQLPVGSHRSLHELYIAETQAILDDAARNAAKTVGVGKGAVYGTIVHAEFAKLAKSCGHSCEVSYKNGNIVAHGTKGSIRLDAVDNPSNPALIADLKTGNATLTPDRIAQILSHMPAGSKPVIIEVRP